MAIQYNLNPGDTCNSDTWWHFLEILPPAYMGGGKSGTMYQVGEPVNHIDGIPQYDTYAQIFGVAYYLGCMSTSKAKLEYDKVANQATKNRQSTT